MARLATAAGYDVVLSNSRGPETLADLVSELGPQARAATPAEAGAAGDLVVVTIPLGAYPRVPVEPLAAFLDAIGYDTVDAGPLVEGWRYQPDTAAYCAIYQKPGDWETAVSADAATLRAALADAKRRAAA